jgi:hypothetical protein
MRLATSLFIIVVVAACGSSPPSNALSSSVASPCDGRIDRGVLPVWARDGFSDREPRMPHVMSKSGQVVAIILGDPLSSPPSAGHSNKILWVATDAWTSPTAEISAQRMVGATRVGSPVERPLDGGLGPSIIDLPDAGCWRLTLTLTERTDTLDLEYVHPDQG